MKVRNDRIIAIGRSCGKVGDSNKVIELHIHHGSLHIQWKCKKYPSLDIHNNYVASLSATQFFFINDGMQDSRSGKQTSKNTWKYKDIQ